MKLKKPDDRTLRFHRAAEQGKLQVAQMLIDNGADVNSRGLVGETVLHSAAADGQSEMVAFLLPLIDEVDARDGAGCTPLYWAARRHQTDVVRVLLKHGADPKAATSDRRTPLHGALEVPPPTRQADEQRRRPSKETGEVDENRADCQIVELLLDSGSDVNARDDRGATPLHAAAANGHLDMTRLLLRHPKVKVEVKSKDGRTPLHMAAESSDKETIKALVEAGASVNAVDNDGRTPLHCHLATRQRRKEVVDYFVQQGANLNAKDKNGQTPLHEAMRSNPRDPLAELLRRHGAKE